MARKIVQIACCGVDTVCYPQCNSYIFALCSDGSLWQQPNNEARWYQLTEIPDVMDTNEENDALPIKAEISAMLSGWKHCCEMGQDWYEVESVDYERLQKLST